MRFKIKKGKHYHSNFIARLGIINLKKKLAHKVKFDKSCWYDYINNDSNDLNKLYGYGIYDHHIHSMRFAWRPNFSEPGMIQIFAYWYEAQKRGMKFICDVSVNSFNDFKIEQHGNVYTLLVNGNQSTIKFEKKRGIWRKGQPYFGGNNTAPNDMIITLKNLG